MERLLLDATYSRKPVLGLENKPPCIFASGPMKNILYFCFVLGVAEIMLWNRKRPRVTPILWPFHVISVLNVAYNAACINMLWLLIEFCSIKTIKKKKANAITTKTWHGNPDLFKETTAWLVTLYSCPTRLPSECFDEELRDMKRKHFQEGKNLMLSSWATAGAKRLWPSCQ